MGLNKTFAAGLVALIAAAYLPAQNQVSLTVDATMDIYRAGGYNDGSDGIAPVVFSFPARAGSTMTFPSVSGVWTCQNGEPEFGADGETSGYCLTSGGATNFGSIGPLSGYHLTDFVAAMAGVFLEDELPSSAPPALRFYVSNSSQGGKQTNFLLLSPEIGQVFFIGDGLTGTNTGAIQTFNVPAKATHLYLGFVDNCRAPSNTTPNCYSDNVGSMAVTARLQNYVLDWVEPATTSAPSARAGAAMAFDGATESTILFGGSSAFSPGQTYGDTWRWQKGWTQLSPANAPPARGGAGMAYDASTGTLVMFGGAVNDGTSPPLGDTWIWDGLTWTQQFPPVSPPARSPGQSGMVYDAESQTILLFGGIGASTGDYGGIPFADTWEWNGKTRNWTQLAPASSPSARMTSLAYDPVTKTVVLFGGDNGGGDCCRILYNDTWTWNGANWTLHSPSQSPAARTRPTMSYDETLGQVVLFGGTSGPPEALNDTWGWTGETWSQLTLPSSPSARYVSSMDFDSVTDGLVLFGGETTGDVVSNQTWILGPVPIP